MNDLQLFISQHVFCYAKKEGQGAVIKSECACNEKQVKCCEAYQEMNEFHSKYKEWEQQGLSRKEILERFEESLKGKESHWFQFNVIK